MRTLTQNLRDDLTGVAWTEEDFEQSLERARNLWREVWPEAGIKFLRGKSTQAAPPPGLPPPHCHSTNWVNCVNFVIFCQWQQAPGCQAHASFKTYQASSQAKGEGGNEGGRATGRGSKD